MLLGEVRVLAGLTKGVVAVSVIKEPYKERSQWGPCHVAACGDSMGPLHYICLVNLCQV